MPTATWTATLPQEFLKQGFQEVFPSNVLRSNMGYGPAKLRALSSSAVTPVKGNLNLTATQVATLKTLYITTLVGGALPFTWTEPISGASCTYRFTEPPVIGQPNRGLYPVSISLEVMP